MGYDDFKAGKATSLAGVAKVDDKSVRVELKSAAPLWVEMQQISISSCPITSSARLRRINYARMPTGRTWSAPARLS